MIRSPLFSSAFQAAIHDYVSGSGNESVPSGALSLVIQVWGTGGSGRKGGATGNQFGGGGGAYSTKSIPILVADWGKAIPYVCGVGGAARTTTGGDGFTGTTTSIGPVTLNSISHTLTCTGGAGGTSTTGIGGIASGGSTNLNGASGTGGIFGSGHGGDCAGGGGIGGALSEDGQSPGGGGGPGFKTTEDDFYGGAGGNPRIRFNWT